MPPRLIENERECGHQPCEAVEEKVSLSDRFGLCVGFSPLARIKKQYLDMIRGYSADASRRKIDAKTLP